MIYGQVKVALEFWITFTPSIDRSIFLLFSFKNVVNVWLGGGVGLRGYCKKKSSFSNFGSHVLMWSTLVDVPVIDPSVY